MRVAAYYRVSSGAQRDAGTIESQRTAARALVASRGWEMVAEHADDGKSARKHLHKRAGLADVLALARGRQIDAVVVVGVDRLTRAEDLMEMGAILGTIQAAGAKVVTAGGEETDLSTFGGRVSILMRAQLAAEESAVKSDRSRRGHARAAGEGRPPCAPPMGLVYAGGWREGGGASIVREVYARAAGGESAARIADDLAARAVPLPRGGRWTAASVIRLLRADVYSTGEWRASKAAAPIRVPALVDLETASAARASIARGRLRGLRRTRHVYLLEGIAACALCGAPVRIHGYTRAKGGKVYRYTYYACERVRAGQRRGACSLPRKRTDAVDADLWREVAAWIATPGLVDRALAAAGAGASEDGRAALADIEGWRARLAAIPALEAEALGLRERGALSAAALGLRLADLGRRAELLARQIASATAAAKGAAEAARAADEIRAAVSDLRERAGEATQAERREIVRALCSDLVLGRDGVSGAIGVASVEGRLRAVV